MSMYTAQSQQSKLPMWWCGYGGDMQWVICAWYDGDGLGPGSRDFRHSRERIRDRM